MPHVTAKKWLDSIEKQKRRIFLPHINPPLNLGGLIHPAWAVGVHSEYQQKLESKQARLTTHPPGD